MGSRHRKQSGGLTKTAVAAVAIGAGIGVPSLVALAVTPEAAPPVQPQSSVQPLQQDGRVVAVTSTTLTAVGPDGRSTTFLVTPDTTSVTPEGGQVGNLPFEVNDEVSIVGEVRGDTAVATAVAERGVAQLNGPPMDYALP